MPILSARAIGQRGREGDRETREGASEILLSNIGMKQNLDPPSASVSHGPRGGGETVESTLVSPGPQSTAH